MHKENFADTDESPSDADTMTSGVPISDVLGVPENVLDVESKWLQEGRVEVV